MQFGYSGSGSGSVMKLSDVCEAAPYSARVVQPVKNQVSQVTVLNWEDSSWTGFRTNPKVLNPSSNWQDAPSGKCRFESYRSLHFREAHSDGC